MSQAWTPKGIVILDACKERLGDPSQELSNVLTRAIWVRDIVKDESSACLMCYAVGNLILWIDYANSSRTLPSRTWPLAQTTRTDDVVDILDLFDAITVGALPAEGTES